MKWNLGSAHLLRFFRLCCLVCFGLLTLPAWATQILVVYSYHPGYSWEERVVNEFKDGIRSFSPQIHIQYLDKKYATGVSFAEAQEALLKERLRYYQYDLIVTVGEPAYQILSRFRDELLLNNSPLIALDGGPKAKGAAQDRRLRQVAIDYDYVLASNIDLIFQLHPEVKRLSFISDTTKLGQSLADEFVALMKERGANYQLLQNVTLEELKAQASTLNSDDAILFGFFSQDRKSRRVVMPYAMEEVSAMANAPIYSLWEMGIGEGIVGGIVSSGTATGLLLGDLAYQILQGRLGQLSPNYVAPKQVVFDYRQVSRWKINSKRLPETAIVINQPVQEARVTSTTLVGLLSVGILFAVIAFWGAWRRIQHQALQVAEGDWYFESMFKHMVRPVFHLDKRGHLIRLTSLAQELLGETSESQMGQPFLELPLLKNDKQDRLSLETTLKKALAGHSSHVHIEYLDSDDQSLVSQQWSFWPLLSPQGDVLEVVVDVQDFSELRQALVAQADNKHAFLQLFEQCPEMLFIINELGVVQSCNHNTEQILGYPMAQLDLSLLGDLYQDRQLRVELKGYLRDLSQELSVTADRKVEYLTRSGERLWIRESIRRLPWDGQFLLLAEDITERQRMSEELEYSSTHDVLTDLYNRAYFERRLQKVLSRAPRGAGGLDALMFIDVDQFKIINDTLGIRAGDQALEQIARVLSQTVPEDAILARLGGDEYGVLLFNTGQQGALALGEQILHEIAKYTFVWEEQALSLSCSIGLSMIRAGSGDKQQVLAQADSACYAAKAKGRNRLHVFEPDDQEMAVRRDQMGWVAPIQQALREDRFVIYAQPIVKIQDEKEIGESHLHYEVLVRMLDEQGKMVPPGVFLPTAENYNLADKLDQLVVSKTLSWLSEHPGHVAKLALCSINLSGQSLGNPEFVEWLLDKLSQTSLPLNKLCFETTETVAISNVSVATSLFDKLRTLGCKIALDDFGSGLSSFGYLKTLPVDYLKIDGIFIRDMESDPMDEAMVRSINEVAHVLGKETIAEFVESQAIMDKLAAIGVDYGQGYFIDKPMPIDMMGIR
jgi:diguanylate cyclase (GGDEF)-like protein/PAS domain S-box-containing protein